MQSDKLLYQLKSWRKEKAKEEKVFPFMILSDKAISNLIDYRPLNKDAMLTIQGMNKTKVEKYFNDLIPILSQESISNFLSLHNSIRVIFDDESFISKKEINRILSHYKKEISFIQTHTHLKKQDVKKQTELDVIQYESLSTILKDIDNVIKKHNEKVIETLLINEKSYLDDILKPIDSKIALDDNQRRVVLSDEDYTLVVAGAGSGKTTTIAAKVKYLVEKKGIHPEEILIVSFTNKAVDELKERINYNLKIPTEIYTFHKVGLNLIRQFQSQDKLNIVHEGLMFNLIKKYLTQTITKDDSLLNELILFFGYYIDTPPPKEKDQLLVYNQKNAFTTIKSDIETMNEDIIKDNLKKRKSINNEIMRSYEEVQIANFLYLNGIDYTYEKPYAYFIRGSKKLYTPDFTITHINQTFYLEHFGISESGQNNRFSYYELEQYKSNIEDKKKLHEIHHTNLLISYSSYNDGKEMLEHLKDTLEQAGIEMRPRSAQEIHQQLSHEDTGRYFNKLIILVMNFISNFKVSGYSEKDFDMLALKSNNVRMKSFLKLAKPIYLYYQAYLSEHDSTDFEDMINQSTQILERSKKEDLAQQYKYIFVDEYQDISRQRFKLTKTLAELTDAKVIAVGDDWQSIYGFAGSQIQLFTNFREEMGYADYLTIDSTYRNAQEVIDVAGSFIQENPSQLKKRLKSSKHIKKPFVLFQYDDRMLKDKPKGIRGVVQEKASVLENIIGKIIQVHGEDSNILVLIRYNFEGEHLALYSELFTIKGDRLYSKTYPKVKIDMLTIHKSKGLGYDNVILLNGSDGTFGFPSQLERDPILNLVLYDDKSIQYAEERRLFYVALTRTKNRVFIMYPVSKPSEFVKEIFRDYENITLHGDLNPNKTNRKTNACPHCNYPLQFKDNKAYGLKLYICTNEVEVCGFMSNNLKGGKHSIEKCDMCKDGFLIMKESKKSEQVFLGCTNYTLDNKGCNNSKNFIEISE
jgi:DNA helicase-4